MRENLMKAFLSEHEDGARGNGGEEGEARHRLGKRGIQHGNSLAKIAFIDLLGLGMGAET